MNQAKNILRVSAAISILLCSVSLFIFSIKGNTATAQIRPANDFQAIGVLGAGIGKYVVVGYNPKTGVTKIISNGRY